MQDIISKIMAQRKSNLKGKDIYANIYPFVLIDSISFLPTILIVLAMVTRVIHIKLLEFHARDPGFCSLRK